MSPEKLASQFEKIFLIGNVTLKAKGILEDSYANFGLIPYGHQMVSKWLLTIPLVWKTFLPQRRPNCL